MAKIGVKTTPLINKGSQKLAKGAKYFVSSCVNEGILEITVIGEITETTYASVTEEVNSAIKANNAKKAIADFRAVEKRIEPEDMYRYFRNFDSVLFEIQYAIVDLPQNVQYKIAALNAGLSSLEWFTDMESAREWIRNSDPSSVYKGSNPLLRILR